MQPYVTNATRLKREFLLRNVFICSNIKYQEKVKKGEIFGIHICENSYCGLETYGVLNPGMWFSFCRRNMLSQAYALKMEAVGSSETVTTV